MDEAVVSYVLWLFDVKCVEVAGETAVENVRTQAHIAMMMEVKKKGESRRLQQDVQASLDCCHCWTAFIGDKTKRLYGEDTNYSSQRSPCQSRNKQLPDVILIKNVKNAQTALTHTVGR
jgi:hypothetical protein